MLEGSNIKFIYFASFHISCFSFTPHFSEMSDSALSKNQIGVSLFSISSKHPKYSTALLFLLNVWQDLNKKNISSVTRIVRGSLVRVIRSPEGKSKSQQNARCRKTWIKCELLKLKDFCLLHTEKIDLLFCIPAYLKPL